MTRSLPARLVAVALASLAFTGCARQISGEVYEGERIGAAVETRAGVVENARYVQVEEGVLLQDNALGGVVGGVAGAAAGQTIGGGSGRIAATAGGALAGAALGALAQRQLGQQTAVEYLVRLDEGRLVTVVQRDETPIPPGSRVFVQLGQYGERARVTPAV